MISIENNTIWFSINIGIWKKSFGIRFESDVDQKTMFDGSRSYSIKFIYNEYSSELYHHYMEKKKQEYKENYPDEPY